MNFALYVTFPFLLPHFLASIDSLVGPVLMHPLGCSKYSHREVNLTATASALHNIFFLATSESCQVSSLKTLRRISQVCSNWRQVALNSPTLWARLLNLDALQGTSIHWRNMFLQRTGTEDLHVTGSISSQASSTYIELIIQCHWNRIGSLKIGLPNLQTVTAHLWMTFQRPAPRLTHFELLLDQNPHQEYLFDETFRLFGASAPLLKSFHAPGFSLTKRNVEMWRFHHLCKLTLTGISSSFEILELLAFLHELESFSSYTQGIENSENGQLPFILLPKLQRILIEDSSSSCVPWLNVLSHIIVHNVCTLDFRAHGVPSSSFYLTKTEIDLFNTVFERFLLYHFSSRSTTSLGLVFDSSSFQICDFSLEKTPWTASVYPETQFVFIMGWKGMVQNLIGSVTRLISSKINIQYIHYLYISVSKEIPDVTTLASFLRMFPSLTSITLDGHAFALCHLLSQNLWSVEERILFPSLHTIAFTKVPYIPLLELFLRRRMVQFTPIKTLDLLQCKIEDIAQYNLECLDVYHGMTIQYQTSYLSADSSCNNLSPTSSLTSLTPQEYVCGMGEGKRLHFCNMLKALPAPVDDSEDNMDCSGY